MKILHYLIVAVAAALMLCGPAWADEDQVDQIIIHKSARTLSLMHKGKIIKTYKVSLGPHAIGPKTQAGDGKTPEGHYTISARNEHSHYHRALKISYPNASDVKRAQKLGVSPGGDIMIHGLPNGKGWVGKQHLLHDWTIGCVALTDEEIDEVYSKVKVGTPVDIHP
jgi:murein L,D-transpeptidase YafK